MKLCADPDTLPGRGGAGRGAAAGPAQGVQAGAAGPHDGGAVLPAGRRGDPQDHHASAEAHRRPAPRRTTGPRSATTTRWSRRSPAGARRSRAGRATSITSSRARCCRTIAQEFLTRLAEGQPGGSCVRRRRCAAGSSCIGLMGTDADQWNAEDANSADFRGAEANRVLIRVGPGYPCPPRSMS